MLGLAGLKMADLSWSGPRQSRRWHLASSGREKEEYHSEKCMEWRPGHRQFFITTDAQTQGQGWGWEMSWYLNFFARIFAHSIQEFSRFLLGRKIGLLLSWGWFWSELGWVLTAFAFSCGFRKPVGNNIKDSSLFGIWSTKVTSPNPFLQPKNKRPSWPLL